MSTSSPRRPGPPPSTPALPASSPASVRPPSRPGPCATPQVILSGHVDTTGPVPLANVCVFVLDASGNGALAMTDAQGNWSISGLPAGFNVVVAFVPFFSGTGGPCGQGNGGGGNPPVPPAGATPTRLLRQRLGQPRRSQPAERPLHLGGRLTGPLS